MNMKAQVVTSTASPFPAITKMPISAWHTATPECPKSSKGLRPNTLTAAMLTKEAKKFTAAIM